MDLNPIKTGWPMFFYKGGSQQQQSCKIISQAMRQACKGPQLQGGEQMSNVNRFCVSVA